MVKEGGEKIDHPLPLTLCTVLAWGGGLSGGALDVPGNVSVEGFDGSAEWNFFWDPSAAKRVRNLSESMTSPRWVNEVFHTRRELFWWVLHSLTPSELPRPLVEKTQREANQVQGYTTVVIGGKRFVYRSLRLVFNIKGAPAYRVVPCGMSILGDGRDISRAGFLNTFLPSLIRVLGKVWDSDLELMLMPLDSTNSLPITKDVILRWGLSSVLCCGCYTETLWLSSIVS